MSSKYRDHDHVPTDVLCARMRELVKAITTRDSQQSLLSEFTMRIPAELDRDADLVMSEVTARLESTEKEVQGLKRQVAKQSVLIKFYRAIL